MLLGSNMLQCQVTSFELGVINTQKKENFGFLVYKCVEYNTR